MPAPIVVAIIALAFSMGFALVAGALRRYSLARLDLRLATAGKSDRLERFLEIEDDLAMTATVWRMLANTVFVASLAIYALELDNPWEVAATAFVAGMGLLVFGAAVPVAWSRYDAEHLLRSLMGPMLVLRRLSWPMLAFLGLFDGLVRRLAGVTRSAPDTELEEELMHVVKEGELEGTLEEEEKEMIESIIEFRDTDVAEIMTPRTDMACLRAEASLAEARDFIHSQGHSRVPVYRETLDEIVGVLYAKDLLAHTGGDGFSARHVSDIMRSPLFIPETKKLAELLHEFQHAGLHIAIVLDEYGGTAGLVTIEDVIEEIVGEIVDEYDESEPEEINRVTDSIVDVDGRARVTELNHELEIDLPEDEDYETIGGFVFSKLGTIPKTGEKLAWRGLTLTVLDADERRIKHVRIEGLDRYVRQEQ